MANDIIEDDDYNPYARLAKELNNRRIIGDLLKFSRQLLAYMPSLHDGWVRWENTKPTNWEIDLVYRDHPKYGANRFRLKNRSELGDNDPEKWPQRGKEQPDPWQRTQYIVLVDPENGQLYTYGVHTKGGQHALGSLLDAWLANCSRKGEAEQPLVKLRGDRYEHSNKQYGEVEIPILEVVGFTDELPQSLIDTGITDADDAPDKAEAAPAQKTIAPPTQEPMKAPAEKPVAKSSKRSKVTA